MKSAENPKDGRLKFTQKATQPEKTPKWIDDVICGIYFLDLEDIPKIQKVTEHPILYNLHVSSKSYSADQ